MLFSKSFSIQVQRGRDQKVSPNVQKSGRRYYGLLLRTWDQKFSGNFGDEAFHENPRFRNHISAQVETQGE